MKGDKHTRAKIRVLVVDDSAVMRKIITAIFQGDEMIEVVGTAPDANIAREKLVSLKPDIMTLDLEMPGLDGVSFLEKVMRYFPTRTIVISSQAPLGSTLRQRAHAAGALDVIDKPTISSQEAFEQISSDILQRVKSVAKMRVAGSAKLELNTQATPQSSDLPPCRIIAIAASTGGTEALKVVLRELPADLPGMLIVQHMPAKFTTTFAKSLDRICSFEVREARDGDQIVPGLALLAPGDFHMELCKTGSLLRVKLHQAPPMHGVRPAADLLLLSVARILGAQSLGVVLTGMGRDGAEGLLAMRKAGAATLVQDEASSVVFGMPKAAIALGGAEKVVTLGLMGPSILHALAK